MNVTLTFTGTSDEIAKVMEALQRTTAETVVVPKPEEPAAIDEPASFVSPELFLSALHRHKLTPHTQKLLRSLCDAEEDARFVSRSALRRALGNDGEDLKDTQLNGVLGKFGMRVKGTPSYVKDTAYFEYKRHDETGEWCYRLPDHLRGVVREVLDDVVPRDVGAKSTANEAGDQS